MKIAEINRELADISGEFKNLLVSVTAEQLNWQLNPKAWCIGQILEHLILVNDSYFPIFFKIQNGSHTIPFYAKLKFLATFNGNMVLRSVQPGQERKTKTFPLWKPKQTVYKPAMVSDFLKHQEFLIAGIGKTLPLVHPDTVVILSPANKYIFYSLADAIKIILNHEKRHLRQVEAVLDAFKKAKISDGN